jgi:hypothetical protein
MNEGQSRQDTSAAWERYTEVLRTHGYQGAAEGRAGKEYQDALNNLCELIARGE